MPRALVTGGAGFIGSHLTEGLLDQGYEVRVLDNFSTGSRRNLEHLLDRIELVEGDVRNLPLVRETLSGVDVVFHEAALPSVARSVANPLESHDVIVNGTLNVLIASRDAGVRRVVYAASSSAYGNQPVLPKVESMTPAPLSPYAIGKLIGEMYAKVFSQLYGLSTVSLRYFNVFGPRQDPTSAYAGALAKFCTCAVKGTPYQIYGDGEQSRDFTYVENVVHANLRAAEAVLEGSPLINIAWGERTTLNQMAALLNEFTGRELPTQFGPERQGDVRHSLADIGLAKTLLGYAPKVDVKEGLRRTLAWYLQNDNA